jgi:hypothetical protein
VPLNINEIALDGVAYELDGHQFETPTAAAKHIQGTEVNGWKFWKMDRK